jgi:hypothetical protein
LADQKAMLARVFTFVDQTVGKLPNFSATRVTDHFEGTQEPVRVEVRDWLFPDQAGWGNQRLSELAQTRLTVLYRDGQEVHLAGRKAEEMEENSWKGFSSSGEFGPILSHLTRCLAVGKASWNRWEQGPAGLQAVFNLYCAETVGDKQLAGEALGKNALEIFTEPKAEGGPAAGGASEGKQSDPKAEPVVLRGEIAIDPESGSIFRLMEKETGHFPSSLSPAGTTQVYGRMVEYDPVVIGGANYLCPLRSVVMTLQPRLVDARYQASLIQRLGITTPPLSEFLNVVGFEQYHLFRSESHILTDVDPQP